MFIMLGMVRSGDLDPGQLLGRCGELVAVAHGGHGVVIDDHLVERSLEGGVGGVVVIVGQGGLRRRPGPARQGNQGDGTFARRNGFRRMTQMHHIGRTTRIRAVHIANVQAHIFHHGQPAQTRRIPGAEIAVHVILAQPRIGKGAPGHLRVQLRDGLVHRMARWMFKGARDVRLACATHELMSPVNSLCGGVDRDGGTPRTAAPVRTIGPVFRAAPGQCRRHPCPWRLFRRHHHDFHQVSRRGQVTAQTGADRRVFRIDPGIPNFIHGAEVAHVRDPQLGP